jgi:signal transduction histidine kinase/CheY-like chemotaxis protein
VPPRLAVLALLASVAAAQPTGLFHPEAGRPALQSYSPAQYGANAQVFTMLQRPDGVRLFGVFGGLAEFDGVAWQPLVSTLGSFRGLVATPDGRVHFTATTDVGWVEPVPGGPPRLHSHLGAFPAEALPAGPFAELVVHRDALHVSTTKGVVRLVDGKVDRFWPLPGATTARLSAVGDRLWFRRMGAPEILELRGDAWVKVVDDPALAGKPVHFVVADGAGEPVLGVTPGGLFRVGPDGRTVPWRTAAGDLLAGTQLYAARTLSDGSLAVGTFSDGLVLVSPDGSRARQVTLRDGLPSNLVQGLGTDRDGRLWICTANGIATLEWPPAFTVFDPRDGVDASAVRSLRRAEGRVLLGGYGGLSAVEPAPSGSLEPPRVARVSARDDVNSSGVDHRTGRILGGTFGLKTVRDGKAEELLRMDDNLLALAVARENPDRLYFAAQKGFGSIVHTADGWRLEGYAAGFAQTVMQVEQTRDGLLWLRSPVGEAWRVAVPRGADGTPDWSRPEVVPFSAIPGWLKEKSLQWTLSASDAGLNVFTPEGVLLYDAAARRFALDARFDRRVIPEGHLFALRDGPEGIWSVVFRDGRRAGGRNAMGLVRFDAGGAVRWVPLREEVATTLGALAAHEVVPDGDVPGIFWLRGLAAVMRLDLPRLSEPPPPAAPLLRSVRRDGGTLAPAADGAELRLPWSRAVLGFQYAAPLSGLGPRRFETRLLGWDARWSAPEARSETVFSGLGAGRYVFEVREHDLQGRRGPVTRVAFAIAPPWWQTPWAWAGYAALVLAAFVAVFRWRMSALEHRRQALEDLVRVRTAELAAARDQAESASRAKSTFLAHMSHELRTPLNGIIGYAQVLLRDTGVAGRQRERVAIVHTSGQHLLRMINEVLDFAKIEAGKLERRDAPFAPEPLLRELAVAHEAAAQARGLGFTLAVAADLPPHLLGDAQKLRQVLDNLLSNAVKFTARGGVTLSVGRGGGPDRWRFAVEDTGVGLSGEDQARLFQPFEQARAGRPAEPGTGLGLAITQRLVRLLGGELAVESGPGSGSRFRFELPLTAAAAPETAARPAAALRGYAGRRRRIAVVDDTPVNRTLLADLLAPLGFEVAEHASAEDLLAVPAGGLAADAFFVDIKMPGLDGLELTRRLRARDDTRAVPVVLTSASVLSFDRAAAARAGCTEFLPKPFAVEQLVDILGRVLGLEWIHAAAPAAPGGAPDGAGGLPAALAAELLALADNGDIAALRTAVARAREGHPDEPRLRQVEAAAASYQLERVRQLLQAATRG